MKPDSDERLDAVRERLYSRTDEIKPNETRSTLSRSDTRAASSWQEPPQRSNKSPADSVKESVYPMATNRRKVFRTRLIAGGAIFFALAAVLSGVFWLFGKNSISGDNISVTVKGAFTAGGGDTYPFTIAIANNNVIPIESATLIIEYPSGTQSAEEKGKELNRDRKQLERINPGEVLNLPMKAVVFGKENEEREIKVSVEYRVEKSNATFYKDATPLKFKISSSPVTLSVDAVKQITSGQEASLEIKVRSNSPTPLRDLLVKVDYPQGFDFTSADPKAAAGENVWAISELKPEEEETIVLRGVMSGKQNESKVFTVTTGVAHAGSRTDLSSVFTTITHEIAFERAFVDLAYTINGQKGTQVALEPAEEGHVEITLTNTLSDTIYDAQVETLVSGNALDKSAVRAQQGFYNSSSGKITWDGASVRALERLDPGEEVVLSFQLTPSAEDGGRTPQVIFTTNAKARRVSEGNVPHELFGTETRSVKVVSAATLSSRALHYSGEFTNTGPIPPVAEKITQYNIALTVKNGSNSLADATVEGELPKYVTWLDLAHGSNGTFSYNSTTRVVTWKIGNLDAGKTVSGAFQVSFLPSVSQVGTVPLLFTDQSFRATDRFTGTQIRATTNNINTSIPEDPQAEDDSGTVRAK